MRNKRSVCTIVRLSRIWMRNFQDDTFYISVAITTMAIVLDIVYPFVVLYSNKSIVYIHLSISINTIAHHTKEWVITHSQKKERTRQIIKCASLTDGHTWLLFIDGHQQQTLPKKRKMINAESPRPSRSTTVAHTFSVSCCCWQLCDDNSSQLFGTRFSFIFLYWRRRKGRRRSTSEMSSSLVPSSSSYRLSFIFCFPVLAICIRIYAGLKRWNWEMSQPRKFLRIIVVFRHRKSGVNAEMFSYSLYAIILLLHILLKFRVIYWYIAGESTIILRRDREQVIT